MSGRPQAPGTPAGILPCDDTYWALDTMERLLTAIGAPEQAGQVRSLRMDLRPAVIQQATRPGDAAAHQPGLPTSRTSNQPGIAAVAAAGIAGCGHAGAIVCCHVTQPAAAQAGSPADPRP